MKRTTINEFEERSSMIDLRDINDFNIINKLKNEIKGCESNLIKINESLINIDRKIIIYTPSLSLGGGNQFILNIYYVLKTFGYKIIIVSMNYNNKDEIIGNSMYNKISKNDILSNEMCNENFILNFKPNIIFLNSVIPFKNLEDFYIKIASESFTKLYFVTHSDVAYSNYFIKKYYNFFDKIITVNNYTIDKLTKLLNFEESGKNKFFKIINYVEKGNFKKNIFNCNKKFGIISRFSEDKNIPMLLHALVEVFKKYPDYKCYLVGTNTLLYDNYLKIIIKHLNIEKNICFEGFQNNTKKYYELFDFIILPSVSEGCSYNIIEALNYGIPVIATNVGGNHELIKNSDHGILLDYTGIRELENKLVYIENYNEHLEKIGYFINNKEFDDNYIFESNIFSKILPSKISIEVIPPIYVNNKHNLDFYKDKLFQKTILWNENRNTLEWGILKMIESPYTHIYKYVRNNSYFIDNEFNENIYINQLIELFC
jgi:glycosyltransferase involved in cell wall biosynthesis